MAENLRPPSPQTQYRGLSAGHRNRLRCRHRPHGPGAGPLLGAATELFTSWPPTAGVPRHDAECWHPPQRRGSARRAASAITR
jgi:hypothetical protein